MAEFFSLSPWAPRDVVYLGGSITQNATGWRYLTETWLPNAYTDMNFTQTNAGQGGTGSWYALTRLQTDVIAKSPDVVTLDWVVNDADLARDRACEEAAIRRLRAACPSAKLVAVLFLAVANRLVDDPTNTNEPVKQGIIALCNRYGIPYVDYAAEVASRVSGGEHLATYFSDNVHPSAAGHQLAHELVRAALTRDLLVGTTPQWTGNLADYARLYDDGSYENTPVIVVGTSRDSVTGTWTTSGSTVTSTVANSTATFSGTFQSFGLDGNFGGGAGTVAWQVDGGGWTNRDLSADGQTYQPFWSGSRAAHTVVFKVISGTVQINRFLAV